MMIRGLWLCLFLCFLLKTLKAGASQHLVVLEVHLFNSYQYFIHIKLQKIQIPARPYLHEDLPYGVRLSSLLWDTWNPNEHLDWMVFLNTLFQAHMIPSGFGC